ALRARRQDGAGHGAEAGRPYPRRLQGVEGRRRGGRGRGSERGEKAVSERPRVGDQNHQATAIEPSVEAPGKAAERKRPTLPAPRPTIALALGGGGARGLAHIPMLEV